MWGDPPVFAVCITTFSIFPFFSLFQLWSVNFPHGLNGQAVTENVVKVFNQGTVYIYQDSKLLTALWVWEMWFFTDWSG